MMDEKKVCFFITPIGDDGSENRIRSDFIQSVIIESATREIGYNVVRSDKIAKPRNILSEIINHLVFDDLVIADITDHNPNVFYELGIRCKVNKPFILIMKKGTEIPFDIREIDIISYNMDDKETYADTIKGVRSHIEAFQNGTHRSYNPVWLAIESSKLENEATLKRDYLSTTDEKIKLYSRLFKLVEDIKNERYGKIETGGLYPFLTTTTYYKKDEFEKELDGIRDKEYILEENIRNLFHSLVNSYYSWKKQKLDTYYTSLLYCAENIFKELEKNRLGYKNA